MDGRPRWFAGGGFFRAPLESCAIRYGGWSLQELRANRIARALMHRQDWYDQYPWFSERLPSGIYVLRLPIPNSNRKTFDEQKLLLLPAEEPAAVVIAATAMLAHCLSGGEDLLKAGWTRCAQQTGDGRRTALAWGGDRLVVNDGWGGHRIDRVWLSSARAAS